MNDISDMNFNVDANIETLPIGCCVYTDDFEMIHCNNMLVKLFGFADKAELISSYSELSPMYQINNKLSSEMMPQYMKEAADNASFEFEWLFRTKDGELLPVKVSLQRIDVGDKFGLLGYITDMRKVKSLEKDLAEAIGSVERIKKYKNDFFSNMGHEIITPMNAIIGMTYLSMQSDNSAKQQSYLKRTEQSAKSLLNIVTDIIDYSKIESGAFSLENSSFNLNDVINEIAETYKPLCDNKNVSFYIHLSSDIPDVIIGDSKRLCQILNRLVGNAVRFTDSGKVCIKIETKKVNSDNISLSFMVQDTGVGMSQKQIDSLFQRFEEETDPTSRKYGGTGLRFTIIKNLITYMNGNLTCESELGSGSAFVFDARFGMARHNTGDSTVNIGSISEAEAGDPIEIIPQRIKGKRILVAEDNEINQILAVELLSMAGFKSDVAVNGVEALKMLTVSEYDLILMDVQMPQMDGITATNKIRNDEKLKNIPVIAMTAYSLAEDKEEILAAGMDDYIKKPIDPGHLYSTLVKWLDR